MLCGMDKHMEIAFKIASIVSSHAILEHAE